MKNVNRKYYLLNYVFVIGLITLFVNDHYFKLEYSNWLTGKLSDFMGMLILPMVLSFFFPKDIKLNVLLSGAFFIFWKSSFSQPFIEFYNQFALIKITRLVDFSDLIALGILPIAFLFLSRIEDFEKLKIQFLRINPRFLLIPITIIFMATSPPYYYRYTFSDGELQCFKCTKTVNYNKENFLKILTKNDYQVTIDSTLKEDGFRFKSYWKDSTDNFIDDYPYYKIDTIIIEQDTITDFQFALEKLSEEKTKVWINGMNIRKEMTDAKVGRKLIKYYKGLMENHIEQSILDNE